MFNVRASLSMSLLVRRDNRKIDVPLFQHALDQLWKSAQRGVNGWLTSDASDWGIIVFLRPDSMPNTLARDKDIKELQRLAQTTPMTVRRRKKAPSRAAQLESIDILSRWSAAGLALIAGIGIFLSVTVGRVFPLRAAAWALMLLAALWVCRNMQSHFRAGDELAARPFRWRASFTACLCVLGVAFASAPILLTPISASNSLAVQTTVLTLVGAFGAAIFFATHLKSAATMAIPGVIFTLFAAMRNGDTTSALFTVFAATLGILGIFAFWHVLTTRISRHHPRTTFLRTGFENPARHQENKTAERQTA